MAFSIVTDSSSDLRSWNQNYPDVAEVPMKITVGERTFVDEDGLDVEELVEVLAEHKGTSSTACPGPGEWSQHMDCPGGVFAVTITSGLSGSRNAAHAAQVSLEEEKPNARIHVVDSLSTGPEMRLLIEKLAELNAQGATFEQARVAIEDYKERTRLLFSLLSLNNLANNGRVSHVVAKACSVLNISIVGRATPDGVLDVFSKCRNVNKAVKTIYNDMLKQGYDGGKVRIAHVLNWPFAEAVSEMVRAHYPQADVQIYRTTGLDSYYAERGGLLVGYELS